MKKLLLSFALFSCSIITNAQLVDHGKETAKVENPNGPDIKFEKMVHDYGTVKQGADGNVEFKFSNTGKEPLIITECKASCGCTTPTCPKQQLIKPGESSVIKVHYDMNRPGPINKSITIASNAKSGEKVLQIKGMVEAKPVEEAFPAKKPAAGAPVESNN